MNATARAAQAVSNASGVQSAVAGRCRCGQRTVQGGECEACRRSAGAALQRRAVAGTPAAPLAPAPVYATLSGSGRPLPAAIRSHVEPLFGQDFSGVRVHTGPSATESTRAVGADAFTVGRNIVFGHGRYSPESPAGRMLLAHELAHVVHQRRQPATDRALTVEPAAGRWEREADDAGRRVVQSRPIGALSDGSGLGVQRGRVASCVVPHLSNSQIGVEAHARILGWARRQNPPQGPLAIPGGSCSREETGNVGFADLLREIPGSDVTHIGEIKPISQAGQPEPFVQLACYMNHYAQNNPRRRVHPMNWVPSPPENGMTPFFPAANRPQFLNCSAPTSGVYYYWCTRAAKRRRWRPERVRFTPEQVRDIRERLERIRDVARRIPRGGPVPVPETPGVPDAPVVPVPVPVPVPVAPGLPDAPVVEPDTPVVEPDTPGTEPDTQPDGPERNPPNVIPGPWGTRRPVSPPVTAPVPEEMPIAAKIALGVVIAACVIALAILLLPAEVVAGIFAAIGVAIRLLAGPALRWGAGAAAGLAAAGVPSAALAAEGDEGTGGEGGGGSGTGGTRGADAGSGGSAGGAGGTGRDRSPAGGTPGGAGGAGDAGGRTAIPGEAGTPGGTTAAPGNVGSAGSSATPGAPGGATGASGGTAQALAEGRAALDRIRARTPREHPAGAQMREAASAAADAAQSAASSGGATPAQPSTRAPRRSRSTGGGDPSPGGRGGSGLRGAEAQTVTPSSELPADRPRTRTEFSITILSGLSAASPAGTETVASVRVELSPPIIVPVHLRVISNTRGSLVLVVTRSWYVADRDVGSPAGFRYTYRFGSRR